MTAVLTTPPVRPGRTGWTGWCLTTLLQTWLHAPKRWRESPKVSKLHPTKHKIKTAEQCSSPPTTRKLVDRWVGFKSLPRITPRIQWKQLGNVQVSENQDENGQVFAQLVLLDACFNHRRDMKMDIVPPAPPADERDDSTHLLLKSWVRKWFGHDRRF